MCIARVRFEIAHVDKLCTTNLSMQNYTIRVYFRHKAHMTTHTQQSRQTEPTDKHIDRNKKTTVTDGIKLYNAIKTRAPHAAKHSRTIQQHSSKRR